MLIQASSRIGFVAVAATLVIALIWADVPGRALDDDGIGRSKAREAPRSSTTADELASAVQDVPGAKAVRYDVHDSAGNPMDTAKIIADPAGGYLAAYHFGRSGTFTVALAHSTDLLNWTYLVDLAPNASQPYIVALDEGGFVLAWEADLPDHERLSFRYYASRDHLVAGQPDRSFDAPHTQVPVGRFAEGTPSIRAVELSPDIDHSTIDVGFHYFRDGEVDRQARGTLRNFAEWTTSRATAVDAAIEAHGVEGNIGDRDTITYDERDYSLVEGQYDKGEFGSWRVFLWDWQARTARALAIRTHDGSRAFANPTLTALPGPDGEPVLVVSLFLPRDAAAAGEAGQLIYVTADPGGPDRRRSPQQASPRAVPQPDPAR